MLILVTMEVGVKVLVEEEEEIELGVNCVAKLDIFHNFWHLFDQNFQQVDNNPTTQTNYQFFFQLNLPLTIFKS